MIAILFLVSLFICFLVSFTPVLVLHIRATESGALMFCAPISSGEEILYTSVNSIYNVPVVERWRVGDDGAIQVVEVVGSAAVMEYYHLDDYARAGEEIYIAAPRGLTYREVRMKVDARGQEKLFVRGNEIALSALVPEAATLVISIQNRPRALMCF